MVTITATMVNELRKLTGAGIMECKKALTAAGGDIDVAIETMRKQGQTKAVNKAGRIAAEGAVVAKVSMDNKYAVLMEINCETDFVARGDDFKQFAENAANTALQNQTKTLDSLLSAHTDDNAVTVEQARQALVAKIGENIQIRRLSLLESSKGVIASYVHGSRIGVLVSLTHATGDLGKDIAMHVAASRPLVVSPEQVSAGIIAKEKEIFTAQAVASGKSPEIAEKMVGGRIKKFLDEVSLLGQPFVKNPDTTVGELLKSANATVEAFLRFEMGEGIEKKVENFTEEVMAQVRGQS